MREHELPDLGLLRAFELLHRERHLTRAARQLGLSQPAMSRTLGRLRALFDDELFVRAPRGMIPTTRADALAPRVRALLQGAQALVAPDRFDPSTLDRVFTLGSFDMLEMELMPRLAALLAEEAPSVALSSRPLSGDLGELLASGRLDLIIGVRSNIPPDAMSAHLFDDSFVCVVRKGHPRVRRSLSLERYVALSHVLIAPRGEPGSAVDSALAKLGLSRRIALRTHTFVSAPLIVAQTDFVLTGPRRVLVPMARALGLELFAPPFELAPFGVYCAWHPRVQHDPVHQWLRALIRRAVSPAPDARKKGAK